MRPWAIALLAAAAAGCAEAKLQAAKGRAETAFRQSVELEASLAGLEQEIAALKASVSSTQTRHSNEEKRLRQRREALVERWNGDQALMRKLAAEAAVPAALLPALEKAQADSAHTTRERRFAEALAGNDLPGIARTLLDWEVRAGIDVEAPEPVETPQAPECTQLRPDHPACEAGPGPAALLLCQVPAAPFTFAAWSDRGRFTHQRLEGIGGQRAKLVRVLAPRVWVLETEGAAEQLVVPHLGEVTSKRWLRAFELGESAGVARVMLPMEVQGRPAALLPADLDGDGRDELVYLAGADVRAVHARGEGDVVSWFGFDTCQKVAAAANAPDEVKRACAARAAGTPAR